MSSTLRMRSLLTVGVSALALVGVAAPAFAQDSVVEEIVVTAQKKEEAIQDVPIAVSAFSQDGLEKSKIDGGPNLVLAIPNVNFSKGNYSGSYNFQIRGIGSKLIAASGDAGTGIHLNNAPLTANNLFETEFYDVERVEVLRGPQGTLYGRNATGGVVNVITAKPVDRFEGMARVEYGNYDSKKLRGMLNIPMGDALALRVAGTYLKRDGYGTNTVTGNDADDRDLYGLRATLSFTPTDNFKLWFVADKFHENDSRSRIGKQYCTKDVGPANVGGQSFSSNPDIALIQRGLFSQGCLATPLKSPGSLGTVNSQSTLGGLFGMLGGFQTGDAYAGLMQDPNIRNISSNFDPIYKSDTDIYELNLDWNITDSLKLTSLSSWTDYSNFTRQDYNRYQASTAFNTTPNPQNAFSAALAGIPGGYAGIYGFLFPGGVVSDPQNGPANRFTTSDISSASTKQYTQEFRLQSSFDGPFNFNVGAIYVDYKATTDYFVMFNTGQAYYQVNNLLTTGSANCSAANPACIYLDPNVTPDRSGHGYFDSYAPYHLHSKALFGEFYYQMADNFKWTLGLRYTDDAKRIENHDVNLGSPGAGVGATTIQRVEFKEWTGRFGFDWKPDLSFTDNSLIYAFYSRGYKAGGVNPPCSLGVGCSDPNFDPEFVNAYEIGSKNTFLNGSLLVNLTGFFYDYKGYQVSKIVNRTSINENINAKIKGLEFESVYSPIRNLRLNASIGYLDTKLGDSDSIDVFDRTQGDPNLIVVKSGSASNCVVSLNTARAGLAASNATNALTLLALCAGAFGPASDGVPVKLKGNELPNSPHFTVTLGAQYTMEFGNGWEATLRGDYYRQSKTFARIYNSEADRLDSWDNVNLTLTVANPDNGWSVEGFVKNATNEKAVTDFYLTDDSSGLYRNAFYTEPRTYGVALSKKF